MTMLNTQVRVQDKGGTTLFTDTLLNWWSPAGSVNAPFDPRVIYDPYSDRWVAVALCNRRAAAASLLIAASQTGNPTGTWYRVRIDVDPSNAAWADYPSIGFNKDWIAITVKMINNTNDALINSRLYVLNKTNLYAGNVSGSAVNFAAGDGYDQVPASTYDPAASRLYLVQDFNRALTDTNNVTRGYLALWDISGSVTNPAVSFRSFISADPWGAPPSQDFAPQSGISVGLNVGVDTRIQNVVFRNSYIWCTHTICLPYNSPTRSAAAWWQIQTNAAVTQRGIIQDQAGIVFCGYPSIAVNRFNDALIGFSRFSTNQFVSGNYAFRAFNDGLNSFQVERSYRDGDGRYYKTDGIGRNRWGDYSAAQVDPNDDASFWTIQEYAATPNGTGLNNGDGRWGTWWGKVDVTSPANDPFSNSIILSGNSGSTNGTTARATRETGEPNHGGQSIPSVWYSWTVSTTGNVIIDTAGSSSATIIAVYTGSSAGSLTAITNGANLVVFNATGGTTYRIAIAAPSAPGAFVLNWQRPTTPIFTLQPESQTKYQGDSVTFTSNAIGNPAASYQWRFNGNNISGATSSGYTKSNIQTNDGGGYTVVASNTSGSNTSIVAQLTVLTTAATFGSAAWTTNNTFQLSVARETNFNYIVQANTNLNTTNWIAITTNMVLFTFTDTTASNYPMRFYRAILKP
jgi:hypothetical protein